MTRTFFYLAFASLLLSLYLIYPSFLPQGHQLPMPPAPWGATLAMLGILLSMASGFLALFLARKSINWHPCKLILFLGCMLGLCYFFVPMVGNYYRWMQASQEPIYMDSLPQGTPAERLAAKSFLKALNDPTLTTKEFEEAVLPLLDTSLWAFGKTPQDLVPTLQPCLPGEEILLPIGELNRHVNTLLQEAQNSTDFRRQSTHIYLLVGMANRISDRPEPQGIQMSAQILSAALALLEKSSLLSIHPQIREELIMAQAIPFKLLFAQSEEWKTRRRAILQTLAPEGSPLPAALLINTIALDRIQADAKGKTPEEIQSILEEERILSFLTGHPFSPAVIEQAVPTKDFQNEAAQLHIKLIETLQKLQDNTKTI